MQDFEEIRKRLLEAMVEFKLKNVDLARICDVSQATIGNIVNGKSAGFDVSILQKLTSSIPINANWILTGVGNIRTDGKESSNNQVSEPQSEYKKLKKDAESGAPHPDTIKYGELQDEHIQLQREYIELVRENKKLEARVKQLESDLHNALREKQA